MKTYKINYYRYETSDFTPDLVKERIEESDSSLAEIILKELQSFDAFPCASIEIRTLKDKLSGHITVTDGGNYLEYWYSGMEGVREIGAAEVQAGIPDMKDLVECSIIHTDTSF
jgi:hypothetical protein